MDSNGPKILIISSDTGGGHRSAAQAISDGFQKFWNSESSAVSIIKAVEGSHHGSAELFRITPDGARLTAVRTPDVRGGIFARAPGGARLLLFHPESEPAAMLQVYDIPSGTWSEVDNPGIAGWEPSSPRE